MQGLPTEGAANSYFSPAVFSLLRETFENVIKTALGPNEAGNRHLRIESHPAYQCPERGQRDNELEGRRTHGLQLCPFPQEQSSSRQA